MSAKFQSIGGGVFQSRHRGVSSLARRPVRVGRMATRGGQQRIPRPPRSGSAARRRGRTLHPDERRLVARRGPRAAAALPAGGAAPHSLVAGSVPAAVLVPLFEDDGEARVVLTKRPETMPSHQGEIAFPGGKLEPARRRRPARRRAAGGRGGDRPRPGRGRGRRRARPPRHGRRRGSRSRRSSASSRGRPIARARLRARSTASSTSRSSELLDRRRVPGGALGRPASARRRRARPRSTSSSSPDETVWGATARILTGFLAAPRSTGRWPTRRAPSRIGRGLTWILSTATRSCRGGSRDRDRQVRAAGLRVRRHRDRPEPAHARPRGRRHLLGARRVPASSCRSWRAAMDGVVSPATAIEIGQPRRPRRA